MKPPRKRLWWFTPKYCQRKRLPLVYDWLLPFPPAFLLAFFGNIKSAAVVVVGACHPPIGLSPLVPKEWGELLEACPTQKRIHPADRGGDGTDFLVHSGAFLHCPCPLGGTLARPLVLFPHNALLWTPFSLVHSPFLSSFLILTIQLRLALNYLSSCRS